MHATELLSVEPKALKLIEDRSHPLYDPRVHMPLDPLLTLAIAARMHVLEPVRVRLLEDGETYGVVAGRQRVRCTCWLNDTIDQGDTQARIWRTWPDLDFRSIVQAGASISVTPET